MSDVSSPPVTITVTSLWHHCDITVTWSAFLPETQETSSDKLSRNENHLFSKWSSELRPSDLLTDTLLHRQAQSEQQSFSLVLSCGLPQTHNAACVVCVCVCVCGVCVCVSAVVTVGLKPLSWQLEVSDPWSNCLHSVSTELQSNPEVSSQEKIWLDFADSDDWYRIYWWYW